MGPTLPPQPRTSGGQPRLAPPTFGPRTGAAFQNFAYIVTEYKPTLGVVFAEYLRPYSHWSYTDIDLMAGDLPLFLERSELEEYDLVTYSFGDYERLYLRGQFAAHKNTPQVNTLWTACDFLGAGLLQELNTKQAQVTRAREAGQEHIRPRFNSAEGCYSAVVTSHPELSIKYATKVLADFTAETEARAVLVVGRRGAGWRHAQLPRPLALACPSAVCPRPSPPPLHLRSSSRKAPPACVPR